MKKSSYSEGPSDLVILYSGGADSRLLVQWALDLGRKPFCVLMDYNQKHIREIDYAQAQLNNLNVPFRIVYLRDLGIESGLTGKGEEGRWNNVHPMNVPGRNTIFISIAFSIAEDMGIKEIWYGANEEDRYNKFPDCYQEYIYTINKLLELAGTEPVKVKAPLLGWSKDMVMKALENLGVKRKDIFSGYEEYKEEENL